MARFLDRTKFLIAGGFYALAAQPSFAQTTGYSQHISGRGVIVFLALVAGGYWLAGYYFKQRRQKEGGETGFQLSAPAWFVLAAIAAAIGNVLFMSWMTSFDVRYDSMLVGLLAIFYFMFGWTLPGTVVAFSQMLQRTPPKGLADAHGNVLIPTLGGYYLTMLWGNEIASSLKLSFF